MSKFQVIAKPNGKFVVASVNETFDEMDSREAAQLACDQLNYEPGHNPCDVFYRSGRWTPRKEKAA